jgi:hypothetical protein
MLCQEEYDFENLNAKLKLVRAVGSEVVRYGAFENVEEYCINIVTNQNAFK